jgi:hypothetical protein
LANGRSVWERRLMAGYEKKVEKIRKRKRPAF